MSKQPDHQDLKALKESIEKKTIFRSHQTKYQELVKAQEKENNKKGYSETIRMGHAVFAGGDVARKQSVIDEQERQKLNEKQAKELLAFRDKYISISGQFHKSGISTPELSKTSKSMEK